MPQSLIDDLQKEKDWRSNGHQSCGMALKVFSFFLDKGCLIPYRFL